MSFFQYNLSNVRAPLNATPSSHPPLPYTGTNPTILSAPLLLALLPALPRPSPPSLPPCPPLLLLPARVLPSQPLAPARPAVLPPTPATAPLLAETAAPFVQPAPRPTAAQLPPMAELEASLKQQTTGIRAPPLETRTVSNASVAFRPSVGDLANVNFRVGNHPPATASESSVQTTALDETSATRGAAVRATQRAPTTVPTSSLNQRAVHSAPQVAVHAANPLRQGGQSDSAAVNGHPPADQSPPRSASSSPSSPSPRRLAEANASLDRFFGTPSAIAASSTNQHGEVAPVRTYALRFPLASVGRAASLRPPRPLTSSPPHWRVPVCVVNAQQYRKLLAWAIAAGCPPEVLPPQFAALAAARTNVSAPDAPAIWYSFCFP